MEHKKSNVVVYQSTEYGKFKFITGNRPLNETKIKRILTDIEKGNDMLKDYPIQVRPSGGGVEILDGQHRYMICKKLKKPVFYILVSEKKTMSNIASVNSNTEKWTSENYINCYIQQGNNNYKRLKTFLEKYKIDVGLTLSLLATGTPHGGRDMKGVRGQFYEGKFEIGFWKEAVETVEDALKFSQSEHYRDRNFIVAIDKIKKAGLVDLDALVEAFKKRPEMLTGQKTKKGYIFNMEEIYSVGKHKRVLLT